MISVGKDIGADVDIANVNGDVDVDLDLDIDVEVDACRIQASNGHVHTIHKWTSHICNKPKRLQP
jgi:hypothetical protein